MNTDKTLTLTYNGMTLRLTPQASGTLRVEAAPGVAVPAGSSPAIVGTPTASGWETEETAGVARLRSEKLRATFNRITGALSFTGADGAPLCEIKNFTLAPAPDAARNGLCPGAVFSRAAAERFYGAGAVGDELRRESAEIILANANARIRVPVLYSSRGYGIFWDNPSVGKITMAPDAVGWRFDAGDKADFYVFAGADADAVIGEYRRLTGAASLFPRWAYGFWYSRNRFHAQAELLAAAEEFRRRRWPLDLIVLDYFYWRPDGAGYTADWGTHNFVASRFPDPRGMVKKLREELQLRFMLSVWPAFEKNTANAKELAAAGALYPSVGHGTSEWETGARFYDAFSVEGRKIYRRQIEEKLGGLGVDVWWADAAEPEIPNDLMARFNTGTGPVSRAMSAYPLLHAENLFAMQRSASDRRAVTVIRSAWAGLQRCAAINWTGDIFQNWEDFAAQIECLQNFCVTGLPYTHTDVGGYEPTPEADRELFVRWFQQGVFQPIFRVHGVGRPLPWEYGEQVEPILREFTALRYRLLPYIYSEAAGVAAGGGSLLRPLVMDFPRDEKALDTRDQYMFGPALLVAPVCQNPRPTVSAPEQFADLTVAYLSADAPPATATSVDKLGYIDPHFGDALGATVPRRVEGTFTPAVTGELALQICEPKPDAYPITATINGRPVAAEPRVGDWQFPLFPFAAEAGKPVRFSFETKTKRIGFLVVRRPAPRQYRDVWLPGAGAWYDFWTGEKFAAGQSLRVETPLATMPLYVRAGAILPLGPELQYAAEQPADPLELRVYRGAGGTYLLREDEGDGYGYETGAAAVIPFAWNEETGTLTIGKRVGEFPGMLNRRAFNIVFVAPGHGVGESETGKPDVVVTYIGEEVTVKAVD